MSDSRPPLWLAVTAAAVTAVAKVLLMKLRTATVLSLLAGGRRGRFNLRLNVDLTARCVAAAGRSLRAECLPQAVALAALLQRSGTVEPAVVLGCRLYGPNQWGAHAWVEVDGRKFDSVAHPEHAELGRLTAAGGWKAQAGAGAGN